MDGDGEPRKDCRGNERKEGESWSLGSSGAGCPIAMEWNVSAAWNGNGNGKGREGCAATCATRPTRRPVRSYADGTTNGLINVPNFLGDGALRVALPRPRPCRRCRRCRWYHSPVSRRFTARFASAERIDSFLLSTPERERERMRFPGNAQDVQHSNGSQIHLQFSACDLQGKLGVMATVVGLRKDQTSRGAIAHHWAFPR